jgi:flagellar biosynthesis/type III secretory pathway protein FliH
MMAKRVVKGSPEHLAVIRGPLLKQIESLQEERRELIATNNTHVERLKWREEALASAKQASATLERENERLRKELEKAEHSRYENARLEGVLQGLERAGKIEPCTNVGYDNGTMRFG